MDEIPDRAIADGNAAFGEFRHEPAHGHLGLGRDPLHEPAPFSHESAGPMAPHLPTRGAALRSRCDQRTTLATLTVKIVATARTLSPAATRSVTLSRRSNEKGLVILASLRPARSLNQIRGRSGIPKPDSPKPDHALVGHGAAA